MAFARTGIINLFPITSGRFYATHFAVRLDKNSARKRMKLKFMNIWLCSFGDWPKFGHGAVEMWAHRKVFTIRECLLKSEMCLRVLIHDRILMSTIRSTTQRFTSLSSESNNKPIKQTINSREELSQTISIWWGEKERESLVVDRPKN